MTITEILEQVKALSYEERKLVAKAVIDLLDTPPNPVPAQTQGHWGQNLLSLLDELGSIEVAHPEIEDPVEWLKTMRTEAKRRRLGNWGETHHEEPDKGE